MIAAAEADSETFPAVDDVDHQRELDPLFFGEVRLQRVVVLQAALADRIEDDDARAAKRCPAQVAEHSRMVRAGVLSDHENRVGLLEILQPNGALADADRLAHGDAAGLVAVDVAAQLAEQL